MKTTTKKMERKLKDNSLSKAILRVSNGVYNNSISSLISIYLDTKHIKHEKTRQLDSDLKNWQEDYLKINPNDFSASPVDITVDLDHYNEHFEYLLIHSLFLTSFSLFEKHLCRLAERSERHTVSKVKLKDIKGNGYIDTIRKYFFLIHELNAANSDNQEWGDILQFKAIRNAIVHNGATLNPEAKGNYEKITGYKKLKEFNVWFQQPLINFRISSISFLENFRDVTFSFSDKLISELNEK